MPYRTSAEAKQLFVGNIVKRFRVTVVPGVHVRPQIQQGGQSFGSIHFPQLSEAASSLAPSPHPTSPMFTSRLMTLGSSGTLAASITVFRP